MKTGQPARERVVRASHDVLLALRGCPWLVLPALLALPALPALLALLVLPALLGLIILFLGHWIKSAFIRKPTVLHTTCTSNCIS